MSNLVILAELIFLVVMYVLILHTYCIILQRYNERKNKPEVLSSDDDINIVDIRKN